MIRAVIADDHRLIREGVRALLAKTEDIEIVGEAATGTEALDQVQRLQPDILLMDVSMPGQDGMETLRQIHALGLSTCVIVLSMWCDEDKVREALELGARGYLLKNWKRDEFIQAIRTACQGQTYISPEVAGTITQG